MLTFFLGVSLTPLATVAALSFTSPLFATLGAILLLKEAMGIRRWTGLILGFAGALVILRPGVDAIDPGALLIVLSSALWACALIDIKILARTESSLTITAWAGLFLTPLSLLAAVWFWRWPTAEELAWLALVGALGSIGQLSVAQALKELDATVVLPLDFTKLIWGASIGYLIFAEIPDVWTFVGGMLILASVTYIAYREGRVKGVPTRLQAPTRPI
ncbi:MAG TPA: DMT family transporter, partial [Geminicoccaceae bacterium]|nr:DMT family transporter [Geminicoccaceae bacterium]